MPSRSSAISVGLIADTHGLLRAQAIEALRGSTCLIHAGDIGDPQILQRLAQIAPVIAVRGNNDTGAWARGLRDTAVVEVGGRRIYVLHDLKTLALDPAAEGFDAVVAGHSHKPAQVRRDGVLYVNPGSAGPRRFSLPISVGKLKPARTGLLCRLIRLDPDKP